MNMWELVRQFTSFVGVGFASVIGHYGLLITLVQGCALKLTAAGR